MFFTSRMWVRRLGDQQGGVQESGSDPLPLCRAELVSTAVTSQEVRWTEEGCYWLGGVLQVL